MSFDIPLGDIAKPCRGCGKMVHWLVTAAGKRMPVDSDGTSHFATCPKASAFRKPRAKKGVCACPCHGAKENPGPHIATCKWADPAYVPPPDGGDGEP